jgi:hypothetical protein
LIALSSTPSRSYQWSNADARGTIAGAKYSAEHVRHLQALLKAHRPKICDLFGYRVACVSLWLRERQYERMNRLARRTASAEIARLKKSDRDSLFVTIQNATTPDPSDHRAPVFAVGKVPGYVPMAAYDGSVTAYYSELNEAMKEPNIESEVHKQFYEQRTFFDISGSKAAALKEISIHSPSYEKLAALPADELGAEVFADLAYKEDVIAGDQIEAFWIGYKAFFHGYSFGACRQDCIVVIERVHRPSGARAISQCTAEVIAGVAGPPENCNDVVVYHGDRTYIRSAVFFNNRSGLNGEGGDEISCEATVAGGVTQEQLDRFASEIATGFATLHNPQGGAVYVQDVRTARGSVTVVAANRFTLSSIFPRKYEISTIRAQVVETTDGKVGATLSSTIMLSDRESQDRSAYKGLSDAEVPVAHRKFLSILPTSLTCRISRGV